MLLLRYYSIIIVKCDDDRSLRFQQRRSLFVGSTVPGTTFSGQPRVFQPHKNSDCNSTSLKKEDVVQKENHKVLIGSVRATINPRPRLEKYTAHGSHT